MVFNRQFVSKLLSRLVHEDTPLIQVVIGPRQVGKTTGVKSVLSQVTQSHYATTDLARAPDHEWIVAQWQAAKAKGHGTVLAIDEIQRIDRWSDIIKALFDEDRRSGAVKVIILGSSSLSLRHGLVGGMWLGQCSLRWVMGVYCLGEGVRSLRRFWYTGPNTCRQIHVVRNERHILKSSKIWKGCYSCRLCAIT